MPHEFDPDLLLAAQNANVEWSTKPEAEHEPVSQAELGTGDAGTVAIGKPDGYSTSQEFQGAMDSFQQHDAINNDPAPEYSQEFKDFIQSSLDERGGIDSTTDSQTAAKEKAAEKSKEIEEPEEPN